MITLQDELDAWVGAHGVRADVATTVAQLAAACIRLSSLIGRGPLDAPMTTGAGRRRCEGGPSLAIKAHELMAGALGDAPVAAMLSPQAEAPIGLDAGAPLGVALDPLDGVTDLGANLPLGTIFAILPTRAGDPGATFCQPGRAQLAAGCAIYGPSTTFVLTLGAGSALFVLDREGKRWQRAATSLAIPPGRPEYAIDASNYRHWGPAIRAYIDDCIAGTEGPRGVDFATWWTSSLAAGAYRVLVRGGLFLEPADARPGRGRGRLRLVSQASPIALIIEQAGGAATDGTRRILDLVPQEPDERTPLVFGSSDQVEQVRRYHEDPPFAAHRAPLFGRRGLFRA